MRATHVDLLPTGLAIVTKLPTLYETRIRSRVASVPAPVPSRRVSEAMRREEPCGSVGGRTDRPINLAVEASDLFERSEEPKAGTV